MSVNAVAILECSGVFAAAAGKKRGFFGKIAVDFGEELFNGGCFNG
ncbi:MAG: hypothetical protein ACOVRM_06975 [Planctomycetaceae bacterium]